MTPDNGDAPDGSVAPPTPSKVAPTSRRRGRTRARLLDAAFTVFADRGFGRASIEEICEAAGFTRGAFYSNFESLDELFFALYEQRSQLIADQVGGVLSDASTDRSVAGLVDRVIEALTLDREWILVRTEFLLHAARSTRTSAAMTSHRLVVRTTLARSLAAVVEMSDLPPAVQDSDRLARAVMAVHDGVVIEMLLDSDPAELKRWLRELLLALLQ